MRTPQSIAGTLTVEENAADALRFLDALPAVEGDGGRTREPRLLAYSPVARVNPFQALLYSRAWDFGIAPLPLQSFSDFHRLPWSGPTIFHVHWLTPVLSGCTGIESGRSRVASFLASVDRLRDDGCKLLWTVHNILPHVCDLPEIECELRQGLADRCDAIHLMNPATEESAKSYYVLPEARTFYAPHPSYRGAYNDFMTRSEARYELGLEPDDQVFLLFGAIQAYKGFDELTDVFDALERPQGARSLRLVVAGRPDDAAATKELQRRFAERDDVLLELRTIRAGEVQVFFRAADILVAPYKGILNSGALMLAFSFGLPVIAPRAPGIGKLVEDGVTGLLYVPNDRESLAEKMTAAAHHGASLSAERVLEASSRLSPARVSRRFFESVLSKLGWGD